MARNRTFVAVSIAVCAAYSGIGLAEPVRVLYARSSGASPYAVTDDTSDAAPVVAAASSSFFGR